jgi:hypothetical protein
MTQERLDKLNHLGFTWSNSTSAAKMNISTAEAGTSMDRPEKRQKTEQGTTDQHKAAVDDTKENDFTEHETAAFDGSAPPDVLEWCTR